MKVSNKNLLKKLDEWEKLYFLDNLKHELELNEIKTGEEDLI